MYRCQVAYFDDFCYTSVETDYAWGAIADENNYLNGFNKWNIILA